MDHTVQPAATVDHLELHLRAGDRPAPVGHTDLERARQFGEALFGALLADGSVRDVYTAAAHDAEAAGRGSLSWRPTPARA